VDWQPTGIDNIINKKSWYQKHIFNGLKGHNLNGLAANFEATTMKQHFKP